MGEMYCTIQPEVKRVADGYDSDIVGYLQHGETFAGCGTLLSGEVPWWCFGFLTYGTGDVEWGSPIYTNEMEPDENMPIDTLAATLLIEDLDTGDEWDGLGTTWTQQVTSGLGTNKNAVYYAELIRRSAGRLHVFDFSSTTPVNLKLSGTCIEACIPAGRVMTKNNPKPMVRGMC